MSLKETYATPNRQYKSTVFTMLYRDPEKLLSLYNALNNSHYSNPEELKIVTLENAVFMAMKNDNAFVLGQTLNLYEHQSSANPNMPLRFLFYVSKEYEKMVSDKSLYSTKKISIPAPEFVVFYNGTTAQPEKQIQKLSDLYQKKGDNPKLELAVQFLNINKGYNERLKTHCQSLREYMLFVDCIRENIRGKQMSLAEAVEGAVTECIDKNILREFLLANRREVVAMSIFEYDEEKELKLLREAEYQAGVEEGREEGRKEGIIEGRQEGLKILVGLLKKFLPDFETVYEEVVKQEEYKGYSKEEVKKYYI